jgi:phosphoglycerate dehydrogenase-like enzyme
MYYKADKINKVAVSSRSFSKHPILRSELMKRYSNVKFNDEGQTLSGDSLVEFLTGCDKAITALESIDDFLLARLPNLKVIGKYGVGLDMIDLYAMKRHNVKLGWKGGVNKRSVSELVVSFSIMLLHNAVFANSEVRDGHWYQVKGRQLSDCTFGIIGCGHVGKDVARMLASFNCRIIAYDIANNDIFYQDNDIQSVGLEYLLKTSDVITLHLPLDNSTKNILDKNRLKLIKKNAVLINLARGGLIDEIELKKIISNGGISGLALDVFEIEPPIDNSFSMMKNVLITPHIGGSTEEAIIAMGMAAIEGLENAEDPLTFV